MAAKPKKTPSLTDKEEAFVEHYVRTWNASDAARQIGIPEAGARVQASRMLTNVNVKKAIQERLLDLRMSTDEWYVSVTRQARSSLGDFIKDDGTIDLAAARKAGQIDLLSEYHREESVRTDTNGEPYTVVKQRIKLVSKQKAFDMLGPRIAQEPAPLMPEAKQAQLEAQVALLQNKLEELQKREVLLAFLEKNATPDVYQEVLRLLTGGPPTKRGEGSGKRLDLRWQDERDPHDPGSEAVPTSDGDSQP